jgi:hypothetical protein
MLPGPIEEPKMVELVVSAEQARLLAETQESVEIVDANGNRLGFFARRFSDRDIETALTRAKTGTSGRSTADVLEQLKTLGTR